MTKVYLVPVSDRFSSWCHLHLPWPWKPLNLPWVWKMFHDVSRMFHPDSPHLTMISPLFLCVTNQPKNSSHPFSLPPGLKSPDPFRLVKASMVEITLPSSRLRNCAEAGRSMAEETSTKERHCLNRWGLGKVGGNHMRGLDGFGWFWKIATKENPSWITWNCWLLFSSKNRRTEEWDGKKWVAKVKKL